MTSRLAGPHRRDARDGANGLPDVRLVADARQPRAGEAQVDRSCRGRVGGVGDGLSRRRRPRPRLDAVRPVVALPACRRSSGRPSVGRRGARHVCLPADGDAAVGRAVALPRRDRRGTRQGRPGARGVRLSLSRGDASGRALPRPSNRLPARLPCRLRLSDASHVRTHRAGSAGLRRPAARRGRASGRRCFGSCRRRSSRRPRRLRPAAVSPLAARSSSEAPRRRGAPRSELR